MVSIDQRHYAVLQLVAAFKQVPASFINEMLFADMLSNKPCYRSLHHLEKLGLLHYIEHQLIGGRQGGSSPFVWELGREGYRRIYGEPKRPIRTVSGHTLEIANTHLQVVRLERAGKLRVIEYLTEPACHEKISGEQLEPDLYEHVWLANGKHRRMWLEVDMASKVVESEGRAKIKSKLARYWKIWSDPQVKYWPDYLLQRDDDGNPIHERIEHDRRVFVEQKRWFPIVVWIVQDEYRKQALQRWVNEGTAESRGLFRVMLLPEFTASLTL